MLLILRASTLVFLTVLLGSYGKEECNFEDYLNYVSSYINFTQNYQLPKDNSQMYVEKDPNSTVRDYGSYDFIIIGGGSAGTVLARRLTEIENFSVLLLEAGTVANKFTEIPAMAGYTQNSPYNWGYKTVPQKEACAGMVNKQCVYPRGRGLGGSHIINSLMYVRGNKVDYDEWAKHLDMSWSYDEVLKYFKKIEHDDTDDPKHTAKYHGYHGLYHINYTSPFYLTYQEILDASKQHGLQEVDINGRSQMGIQRIPYTIKDNKRQTGATAYVQPVLNRKNLKVSLDTFVKELIIEGNTVNGVEFIKNGKYYKATAKQEVLLCAGAINSPHILMLNGIGPKDELKKHKIEVKNDLPVGEHLTDHPAYIGLYMRTNQSFPNLTLADYLKRYLEGSIPLTNSLGGQHVGFINTKSPGMNPPDIEFCTSNPPMSVPPQTALNMVDESYKPFHDYNSLTDHSFYIIMIKPKSRGTVKLQSKSPVDFPLIDPAYFTDSGNEDIQSIYKAVQFLSNLTTTPALKSVNATIITKSPKCEHLKAKSDEDYWYCAIKEVTSTLYHPCCTTRMGVSPHNSVVDSEFRVHNMKKLRVCDAGAMPEIIRGHLVAPVTMMAEKLADILKREYLSAGNV